MKELVQKLRDLTGAGVMECKKALESSNGDIDSARLIIQKTGLYRADKKSQREAKAGLLSSYIHNNRVGVLLELRCETDFVAKTDTFKELARSLTMQIAAMNPVDIDALIAQPYIKDESRSVEDIVKEAISRIGENIKVERFCRYEL